MKVDLGYEFENFDGSKLSGVNVKSVLMQYLGTFGSQVGSEVIAAYDLGLRVYNSNGEIELSDDDVELINKTLHNPQHIAIVYAQIARYFKVSEDGK